MKTMLSTLVLKSDVLDFFIEEINNICIVFSLNGRILKANSVAYNSLGFSAKKLIDKTVFELLPTLNSQDGGSAAIYQDLQKITNLETFCLQQTGDFFPICVNFYSFKMEEKRYYLLIGKIQAGKPTVQNSKVYIANKQVEVEEYIFYEKTEAPFNLEGLISVCPDYQKIIAQLQKVAPTEATVLIAGETGTGKEVLANIIHKNSRRQHKDFWSLKNKQGKCLT